VTRLIRQNSGIRELRLVGLLLTDAALRDIAILTQLSDITVADDSRLHRTTEGGIALLRGRSRPFLQCVFVNGISFNKERIEAELRVMSQETGVNYVIE